MPFRHPARVHPTTHEIQAWLIGRIAGRSGLDRAAIDPRRAPASYGLDSLAAIEISGDLEQWLGVPVVPTLAYEYPTIEKLARHLAGLCATAQPSRTPPVAAAGPIAIAGMSCRVPGARGTEAFWRLLRDGVDAVGQVPRGRWPDAGAGTSSYGSGGFLDSIDMFDAGFFEIHADEADGMDPQQRLLLELAWETLEDAGQDAAHLAGSRTGVFIGISNNDYLRIQPRDRHARDLFWSTGNALSIAANRISYQLDLRGPSLAVDTACSSSLVAVHLAIKAIQAGECDMALAGGVNLMVSPEVSVNFAEVGAMSRSGRCRAFDASADGMVRGEGAAVVLLKPLERAQADGDRIHAVVLGSAAGQDGRTNGLAAPNREAQEAVLREALGSAGLTPRDVQYIEAHGTGTLLGDPVEARALGAVLKQGPGPADHTWWVGSLKTNIGHLEAAAGIAGLVKAVLSLVNKEVPPSLHFRQANPYIDFDQLGLRVPTRAMAWPPAARARAGVSAFGFGGTNAHVILEEAPRAVRATTASSEPPYVLTISARGDAALTGLAGTYRRFLADPANSSRPDLGDVCYSAAVRRTHHPTRLAMVFESPAEAVQRLDDFAAGRFRAGSWHGQARRTTVKPVFVYSGFAQGHEDAGRELHAREGSFRAALDAARAVFESDREPGALAYGQRRLFGFQLALTAQYRSMGIAPGAVIGYSMGEVAAVHAAGALSLDDAGRVIAARSALLQEALDQQPTNGGMAIVRLSRDAVARLIASADGALGIAAVNSPEQVVVSGESEALDRLLRQLRQQRIAFRRIDLPGAGHSSGVTRLATALEAQVDALSPGRPAIPIYSTVTGERLEEPAGPAYWARNMSEAVRLSDAVNAALADGFTDFIEISPDGALSSSIAQVLKHADHRGLVLFPFTRGLGEWRGVLNTLAALYAAGHTVDWESVTGRRTFVALPHYPWQRARCWIPADAGGPPVAAETAGRHFLSGRFDAAHPAGHVYWRSHLVLRNLPWLADHRVHGARVLTSAAFLAAGLDAAEAVFGDTSGSLEAMEFRRALFLSPSESTEIQIAVAGEGDAPRSFLLSSRAAADRGGAEWVAHAVAQLSPVAQAPSEEPTLRRVQDERIEPVPFTAFYAAARAAGVEYGPGFQALDALWRTTDGALARVIAPESISSSLDRFRFHPAVLDACLQVLAATAGEEVAGTVLPVAARRMTLYRPPSRVLWSYARRLRSSTRGSGEFEGDVRIFDDEGEIVGEVLGFRVRRVDAAGPGDAADDGLYELRWRPLDEPAPVVPAASGSWWIVGGPADLSAAVASGLASAGHAALVLGDGGLPDGDAALAACGGVVYLGGLSASSAAGTNMAAGVRASCEGLLAIVRRVATRVEPPRVWVVTCGAQATDGQREVAVAQTPLWGLARTLAQEHPACWGAAIDLDPSAAIADNARGLCERLVYADSDDQIAIRDGRRYGARLEKARRVAGEQALRLRADATYVVTGGLGDLGLLVARWMVERGARHLLLVGRSGLPPRRAWHQLPAGSREADRVRQVRDIEAAGASVHLATADVADAGRLRAALDEVAAEARPPIRGVVHLAGDVHGSPIIDLHADTLMTDLQPKAIGAWNLHQYFTAAPPDFFVLFSSGSSLLGSPFLGSYAASNAFLDGLAHARRIGGAPALSINWGLWSETGMAARALREHDARSVPHGMRGMDNHRALEMLRRVWHWDGPQVAVMPMDWKAWAARHGAAAAAPMLASLTGPAHGRPRDDRWPPASDLRAADPAGRMTLLSSALAGHLARVLGCPVDRIDPNQPLTAIGIDSLMAVEIKNRIETEWGLALPMVQLLQGPTLAGLAALLAEQLTQPEQPRHLASTPAPAAHAAIEQLSDEEVDELLATALKSNTADE